MNRQRTAEQKGRQDAGLGGPRLFPWATIAVALLTLALAGCRVATQDRATATATLHPTRTEVATVEPFTPTPSVAPTHSATPLPTVVPAPTASPAVTQTTERSPLSPGERATLQAIAEEVAQLRDLDDGAAPALAFMTSEKLRDWLVDRLTEDYPPQEAERDARVYAALGLLPPDTDLTALALALYTEQIAGFYDHEADRMAIVDDEAGLDALDRMTFAHETAHALQDQFLGLDDLQTTVETAQDDDVARAVLALIEGDAQMVTLRYLLSHLSELDLSALDGVQTDAFDAAPAVLRQEMLFPYVNGLAFVQALHGHGGWEAVNDAYSAPPQSTEQILHPEKYLAGEAPLAVSLPPLTSTLRTEAPTADPDTDWQLVTENTLGEFLLHLYLGLHLPDRPAQDASAGWGGDRFALYERPASGDRLLLIAIAWDSEAEAAEFAAAYAAFAAHKVGDAAVSEDSLGTWWQGEDEMTLLSAVRGQSIVIVGPGRDLAERVRQVLAGIE